jgi:hypothetical protein
VLGRIVRSACISKATTQEDATRINKIHTSDVCLRDPTVRIDNGVLYGGLNFSKIRITSSGSNHDLFCIVYSIQCTMANQQRTMGVIGAPPYHDGAIRSTYKHLRLLSRKNWYIYQAGTTSIYLFNSGAIIGPGI